MQPDPTPQEVDPLIQILLARLQYRRLAPPHKHMGGAETAPEQNQPQIQPIRRNQQVHQQRWLENDHPQHRHAPARSVLPPLRVQHGRPE